MIYSERDLEDYICDNQEKFIEKLKETISCKNEKIKFLGRQVAIGNANIADLVYYYDIKMSESNIKYRNYIIVELKNRPLEAKDLAQIGRYITTLYDKLCEIDYNFEFIEIKGVLLGHNLDDNMQEIQMLLSMKDNDIYFMDLKTNIEFESVSYSHNADYINNLKLDERLDKYYKKEKNKEE